MKLIFVLTVVACINANATVFAQRVNLNVEKASLEEVFSLIKEQTGYKFFYEKNVLNGAPNVSLHLENVSITEALNLCFKDKPFTFIILRNTIGIKKKDVEVSNIRSTIEIAAPIVIAGKVTDSSGNPLSGVSVFAKGTKIGTMTNSSGAYTLTLPKREGILVFSYVGYESKEIAIGDEAIIDVKLIPNVSSLSQLVVVGYGTQKTTKVTGAVSTIDIGKILGDRPVSTASALLLGAVPGIQVSINSGQPGAVAKINVRGGTDLATSGNTINTGGPLILIDNVPFNGSLDLINPSDIETITFLKDAGSAAIYGGRSSFGVLLVTLKKGKKNHKPQFSYSNNITIASATNLPVKANAKQFLKSLADAGTVSYYTGQNVATWTTFENDYIANSSKYPGGIAYANNLGYQLAPTNSLTQVLGHSVPQFQNNLSVSGGSDNTTYRLSFGYVNDNGIIAPQAHVDNFKKFTVSSMVSTDITKYLTGQLSYNFFNSKTTRPAYNPFSLAQNIPVLSPVTDSISVPGVISGINGTPLYLASNGGTNQITVNDNRITGRAILKPIEGLNITAEYTYEGTQNNQTNYSALMSVLMPTGYNPQIYGTGVYQLVNSPSSYKSLNIFGNYNKSFGNHNLSLLLGYNQEASSSSANSVSRNGEIVTTLPSIPGATGSIVASQSYSALSLMGYFGRFNYDYKGKYLLQLGGRYDGSSNFPKGHRFGFFPSGSAGWRVTEEKFMRHFRSVLNELKLRASYGSVGNQNINPYQFIPTMSPYNPNWLTNTSGLATTLSSPGVVSAAFTWEKVATLDFGTDFQLLNRQLTGSFDWYRRITSDILAAGAIPLPAVLGTTSPLQNTASLTTKGFEVSLTWTSQVGKVKYWIGGNVYNYQSIVTQFFGNPNNFLNTYYVGQKMGSIWGLITDRLYTSDDFISGTLNANMTGGKLKPGVPYYQGELPNPGDIMYKPLHGDTIINRGNNSLSNPGDQKIIGNNTPQYQFGLRGGVSYKNFEFSFVMTGVAKQSLATINALLMPNNYPFATLYQNELNYWTPTNTNAFFGRIYDQGGGNQSFNQMVQTRYLLNGAYLRINNLTLGYNLPENIVRKVRFVSAKFFVSVENPFLFDHLPKGVDPSLADQGDGLQYPFLRKTSFGLNVVF